MRIEIVFKNPHINRRVYTNATNCSVVKYGDFNYLSIEFLDGMVVATDDISLNDILSIRKVMRTEQ